MDKDTAQETLARDVGDTLRGLYKHYRGGLYIVFSESVEESTGTLFVHYYSIEKRTRWTRTVANFCEKIDIDDGCGGTIRGVERFMRIRASLNDELYLAAFDID